ncbi:MAG: hypothetical protein IJW97_07495 [Clostridia bacterium]|nr:hypothetical protein [Clostridia bacterium]
MNIESKHPDYILGVDAGGTRVHAVAYAADGSAIAQSTASAANLAADFSSAVQHILQAVDTLIAQCGTPCFALLGCAGAETGDCAQRLHDALSAHYAFPLQIESDARLAYRAAFGEEDGILVIAGTGSIAYRGCGDGFRRSGGWGHLIGDGGSGYDIAMRAIRHVTALADRGLAADALQTALLAAVDARSTGELVAFVYRVTKADIAALCPIVTDCAAAGCAAAQDILCSAGTALADTVRALLNEADKRTPVKLALCGSVLRHVTPVREAMLRVLAEEGVLLCPQNDTPNPTYGAYRVYRRA